MYHLWIGTLVISTSKQINFLGPMGFHGISIKFYVLCQRRTWHYLKGIRERPEGVRELRVG